MLIFVVWGIFSCGIVNRLNQAGFDDSIVGSKERLGNRSMLLSILSKLSLLLKEGFVHELYQTGLGSIQVVDSRKYSTSLLWTTVFLLYIQLLAMV